MSSILDRIDEIEASMDEREAESNTAQTKRRAGGSEGDLIRSLEKDLMAGWGEDSQTDIPEEGDGLDLIDLSDLPDEPPQRPQPERKPAPESKATDEKKRDKKASDKRKETGAASTSPAKQETTADRYMMDLQKSFASFKQGLQDDLEDFRDETGMDAKSMRRENAWEEIEDLRPDAVYAKPVNFDDLVFEGAELFEEAARTGAEKSRLAPFEDDLFEEEFEQEERPASRSRTTAKTTDGSRKKLRVILLIVIIVIAILLVVFWLNAFGVF